MEPFVLKKEPFTHLSISSWESLLPSLSVGFSTKEGGVSENEFSSLNLALHVNDEIEHVIENRQRLAKALNFPFDAWTSAEQVHGNRIVIVEENERGKGRLARVDAIQDTDGIVTNKTDVLLTSFYADCVPLYFLDPVNKVIGLAHAGWKGTVLKISEKMIETFVHKFNSRVENIKVAIGPAIDQCCYEVDDKVISQIRDSIKEVPEDSVLAKGNGHYDLDLKKINKQILLNAGILAKNIEFSLWCTSCSVELFYSHRRDKGKTGRMASWIGFRKET